MHASGSAAMPSPDISSVRARRCLEIGIQLTQTSCLCFPAAGLSQRHVIMRRNLLSAVVICAAHFAASGSAKAEVIFNETLPFSGFFFNDCTGEFVLLEGEMHMVSSFVLQEDLSFRLMQSVNVYAWGIGFNSGAEYRWNENVHLAIVDPAGIEHSFTQDTHSRLIGLGDTPDERVVATFLFEVDEFGVITFVTVTDMFCTGL